jgi:hypothetical protein
MTHTMALPASFDQLTVPAIMLLSKRNKVKN